MYTLMVVDDEEYAVLGIAKGIDWAELGIGRIFEAYEGAEAVQRLTDERIDLMICDIEMPEISGLDLVRWTNEHSPRTKTLFLTGHADFSYARQAVRLDCADFLLKPVEHEVLKQRVQEMIETIVQEQETAGKMSMYETYRERFESQKPFYVENLWKNAQHNMTKSNRVVFHSDGRRERTGTAALPPFAAWSVMMEAGKRDELAATMLAYLDQIDPEETPKELLESFCFGIIHMVYSMFHKQGMWTGGTSVSKELIQEGIRVSHIQHAGDWAVRIVTETIRDVHRFVNHHSAIVTGVKTYIRHHVYEDISREELAGAMNYNPDYLSRVFKRETGMMLSDYIICVRMNEAKRLIEESDEPIGRIAEKLGYTQLSYFSKVFRNCFGVSPRELRKSGKS